MELLKAGDKVVASIGPLLKGLIRQEGYKIHKFAELIGMKPGKLYVHLYERDLPWSTMNEILRPLGYHLVIERRHDKSNSEDMPEEYFFKHSIPSPKLKRQKARRKRVIAEHE